MSAKSLGSNPPECKECGARDNLAPCANCQQPVCPRHRWSGGSASEYYCTAQCSVLGAGIVELVDEPHFGMGSWKKHTLFYALIAIVIFACYYWRS